MGKVKQIPPPIPKRTHAVCFLYNPFKTLKNLEKLGQTRQNKGVKQQQKSAYEYCPKFKHNKKIFNKKRL